MRGESIVDLETVRRRKDGTPVHISVNISPITEAGRVVRVCSIARDIGARKETEKALHAALAREKERATELAAVLDAVPAIVLIAHDRLCERITGNRAASETLRMAIGANMSKNPRNESPPVHFRVQRNGADLHPDDVQAPPDEVVLAAERERYVRRALALLPSEQALLLRLSFLEEHAHAAISKQLGMPLGTVKSRIRLAVATLRRTLEDFES